MGPDDEEITVDLENLVYPDQKGSRSLKGLWLGIQRAAVVLCSVLLRSIQVVIMSATVKNDRWYEKGCTEHAMDVDDVGKAKRHACVWSLLACSQDKSAVLIASFDAIRSCVA